MKTFNRIFRNNSTIVRYRFTKQKDDFIDIGHQNFKQGMLTICPTPIGNLQDLSIRQYNTLTTVDVIACEDTRITGRLFELMKQRKIKEYIYDNFDIDLSELKDLQVNQDYDDLELNQFLDKIEDNQELGLKTQQQRLIEKIREIRQETRKIKLENNTLNIYSERIDDEDLNQSGFYGIEDEFIKFLKIKIQQTKKTKGRGILISYHKYNEEQRIDRLIKILQYGINIALVSDAGTPTISDPGYLLIDRCKKQDIQIDSLPGSCSIIVALSSSGFPSDRFIFEGYLSKRQALRNEKIERMKQSKLTSVFFENLQRIGKTLLNIEKEYGPEQMIYIGIELTKLHQKQYTMTVREFYDLIIQDDYKKNLNIKGELTVVVAPYMPEYNRQLQFDKNQQNQTAKYYKDEWDEEIKNENDSQNENHLFTINAVDFAKRLDERLEMTSKDMAQLLAGVLKISKSRATQLVFRLRHQRKPIGNITENELDPFKKYQK